ncbi:hypothetical protein ACJJJB_12180 [Microbulbifer sp. ANSA001]|uniref:hypothetical protein n=1 Tax=Microbulbifer sp. ANSA001 TaxID=3243358 RepID=UPI0040433B73
MMNHFGLQKARFCGCDRGGFIVDAMALLYSGCHAGLTNIGTPHIFHPKELPAMDLPIKEITDKPDYSQFLQQPEIQENLLNNHVDNFFCTFFQKSYLANKNLSKMPNNSSERKVELAPMISSTTG